MYLTRKPEILFYFGIATILGLVFISASQRGIANIPKEVATPETPAVSPSGQYILVVVSGYDGQVHFQSFQILNQRRKVLYSSPENFAKRHRTYFLWDRGDRIWIYSGDIGTFFWERRPKTAQWEKHSYAQSNVPAPEFLKNLMPERFPR